LTVAQFNQL